MTHSFTQCTSAAGSSKLTSPKLSTRLSLAVLALAVASTTMFAAPKTNFKVAWTIYAGWMPWDYGARKGIVKKWADKYGIKIDVVQLNDYVESINQYSAGSFDGCVMTNMDALTIPAAGGVDSTAVIIGDYSNGNDGIVSKSAKSMKELKGQKVNLVEYSVSHYLLERGLSSAGLSAKDVKTVNTSDADIVSAFNSPSMKNVVTWNPQLNEVKKVPGAKMLFDSSKIPGEIKEKPMTPLMKPLLPESILFDEILPGGGRWSKIIRKGQVLRIINTEATSGLSALFYNVHERTERYNAADTVKIQYNAYLKAGNALYSDMGRILMSIITDSCETHDTVCGYTMASDIEAHCGIGNYQSKRNCYYKNDFDNFLVELGKYGMGRRDIMPCLNLFADVKVGEAGELIYRENTVPAGSFIELRAEMDVLAVFSNTVHILSTDTSYDVKPISLIVYQGDEVASDDPCVIDSERSERAFVNTRNYMKQFAQGGKNV